MGKLYNPSSWQAVSQAGSWVVKDKNGRVIASVNSSSSEADARLIAASPYMLEALKATVGLIGDEDLPDNGEVSGAAISDMVRSAIQLATGEGYLSDEIRSGMR